MKKEYDTHVVKLCNKLIVTQCKSNKKSLCIEMLKQCILKFVVPKWILFRIRNSKLKTSSKVENLFLKFEIIKLEKIVKYLNSVADSLRNDLENKIKSEDFKKFLEYINSVITKHKEKLSIQNQNKIKKLVSSKYGTLAKCSVINLSKRELSEQESFALSLGLNFSLPSKQIDKESVFLGFEKLYKQLSKLKPRSDSEEVAAKVNLASIAYNYCKLKSDESEVLNISEIRKVIGNLKKDDSVIISKPDKGNGCVILDKTDYTNKMQEIIGDKTKFTLLGPANKFDNINKVEDEIVKILKNLLYTKEINEDIYNLVKPVGSITPRMYGLPKIHKKDAPLRPILSMVNSAQHKLAKFLNDQLYPVLEHFSSYILKDSFSFVDQIKNIASNNTFMASFDVKSLFTNVPLDEVVDICVDTLYRLETPSISKINFRKLLKLTTSGVKFTFNSQMYSQHDGIAMGSPLGPTLANIFMGFIERKVISKYKVTYFRYVDDCFVLAENEKYIDELFSVFNKTHSSITFTSQKEK